MLQLASYDAGSRTTTGRGASYKDFLPVPRPVGHLQVLGFRGDTLWMMDPTGKPVLLRITHPGETSALFRIGLLQALRPNTELSNFLRSKSLVSNPY